jgi:hypothetical protein
LLLTGLSPDVFLPVLAPPLHDDETNDVTKKALPTVGAVGRAEVSAEVCADPVKHLFPGITATDSVAMTTLVITLITALSRSAARDCAAAVTVQPELHDEA